MTVLVWILLCLIWGSTWIVIKIGLEDLPPITFAACRFIVAGAILAAVVFARKLPLPKTSRQWRLMAVTGVLQFTINYATVFWSEQYIPSGLAAVLQTTIPVFGLLLAWKFLPDERITPLKVAAVCAGIVGVAIIFIDQLAVQNMLAFLASVAIVVGALAAAYASIMAKSKASGMDPAVIVVTQILFGLPPILLYALIAEGNLLDHNWSQKAVLSVLYLAVVGTIAAFWLYYWLLNRIESTKAMIISLVTPIIAVAIGAAVADERLTTRAFAGGALVMIATGLIVYRKKAAAGE